MCVLVSSGWENAADLYRRVRVSSSTNRGPGRVEIWLHTGALVWHRPALRDRKNCLSRGAVGSSRRVGVAPLAVVRSSKGRPAGRSVGRSPVTGHGATYGRRRVYRSTGVRSFITSSPGARLPPRSSIGEDVPLRQPVAAAGRSRSDGRDSPRAARYHPVFRTERPKSTPYTIRIERGMFTGRLKRPSPSGGTRYRKSRDRQTDRPTGVGGI